MCYMLNDYEEESVITPKIWFDEFDMEEKIKEMKNVKKFIISFPYMKNLIRKAESLNFKKVEWYPNLGIFSFENVNMGLCISSIGAPAITTRLEELIYMGGEYFVLVGYVGVLLEKIKRGDVIIPDRAIRDEGTSYHYFPPEKYIKPSNYLFKKLINICKNMCVKFHVGGVWTTDAPYRETPTRIKVIQNESAICVDMEASACFAVSKYHNVDFSAIFLGGDYVNEREWHFRKDILKRGKECEEKLFRIACKTLKEIKL